MIFQDDGRRRVCEWSGCGQSFVPTHRDQKHCVPAHKRLAERPKAKAEPIPWAFLDAYMRWVGRFRRTTWFDE